MSAIESQRLPSEHSADDVWNAINTPLSGELGRLVNPYVVIEYADLSDEGMMQRGTRVTYIPNLDELGPVLGVVAGMLPEDVDLLVEEHDPQNRVRVDVLESDKHAGRIRHRVEEVGETGLLIVEGEISLGGSRKMFEGPITSYAERGLAGHSRRVLDHLPAILGR